MKPAPRLHCDDPLTPAAEIALPREQSHYLTEVLRLGPGDPLRLFNGRDGEWLCHATALGKKSVTVRCERKVAEAMPPPDIDFLFAPLKHARLDYMVQKAVELGVRRLRPVITARTIATRVNLERMRANAIEAAQQCNQVHVPEVLEPVGLKQALESWDRDRALIHCDETAARADPVDALRSIKLPAAVLTGPEGGFGHEERQALSLLPGLAVISLGPRIMRADTAAVAALALVQAVIGDWALRD